MAIPRITAETETCTNKLWNAKVQVIYLNSLRVARQLANKQIKKTRACYLASTVAKRLWCGNEFELYSQETVGVSSIKKNNNNKIWSCTKKLRKIKEINKKIKNDIMKIMK